MTRAEFAAQLEEACPNVFCQYAPIGTNVPYIVYQWDYNNFGADNQSYQRVAVVTVTHYHADYSAGDQLKQILDENDIFWNCSTAFDADEDLYIDTYTMEVLEDG